jgi:hypothetical protein
MELSDHRPEAIMPSNQEYKGKGVKGPGGRVSLSQRSASGTAAIQRIHSA